MSGSILVWNPGNFWGGELETNNQEFNKVLSKIEGTCSIRSTMAGNRKAMGYSRRDIFKGIMNREIWKRPAVRPVLPEGVDILLEKDACIAWGRGVCTLCKDVCEEDALYFVGMMNPRILLHRCTLCADCGDVCPTGAIVVREEKNPNPTGEPE